MRICEIKTGDLGSCINPVVMFELSDNHEVRGSIIKETVGTIDFKKLEILGTTARGRQIVVARFNDLAA